MTTAFTKTGKALFLVLLVWMGMASAPAHAALTETTLAADLSKLVLEGNDLVASMNIIALTSANMSTEILRLEASVDAYQASVISVFDSVAAAVGTTTLSLTDSILVPMQTLATVSASLAAGLMKLSATMVILAPATGLEALLASLTAMLRLSDDIGLMADRILEMADKILVMADNIGLMADRILATQVIQSTNIKIVVDAILQTQLNTILLIATFS